MALEKGEALLGSIRISGKNKSAAPRVHCITNYVTAHDVANMILACGANPVMADEPQEMGEISGACGGARP